MYDCVNHKTTAAFPPFPAPHLLKNKSEERLVRLASSMVGRSMWSRRKARWKASSTFSAALASSRGSTWLVVGVLGGKGLGCE